MTRKAGFTLIEVLTVIAIIAMLAAITFPVFSRAKDSAYRNADIASMNAIRSALQLYRVDQGGYPPALLGYVTPYQDGSGGASVVPADLLSGGFLYPKRVNSIDTFRPSPDRVGKDQITSAVYPSQDSRPIGSAPILDLNGDGAIDDQDDLPLARQAFGPGDGDVCLNGLTGCGAASGEQAQFYRISGYDVATVPAQGGGDRVELRYALFWTGYSLTQNGNAADDPRQLGYSDPPETTVITWNSFYRDFQGGVPGHTKRDIVLFLGGAARAHDSADVADRSWRVLP